MTKEDFKGPRVLVDFWASWCGPCKIMKPTLEKFAIDNPDIEVIFCNVDEESDLAKDYGIKSIPTLLYFEHGEIKGKRIGNVPETQLKELFTTDKTCPAFAPVVATRYLWSADREGSKAI